MSTLERIIYKLILIKLNFSHHISIIYRLFDKSSFYINVVSLLDQCCINVVSMLHLIQILLKKSFNVHPMFNIFRINVDTILNLIYKY